MKSKSKESLLGQRLFLLTVLFLFLSGVFGVGTVWLRHEIASTGSATRSLEMRLVEIERHKARVNAEIAQSFHPSFLEIQNERFALGLRPAREEQVLRISAEAQERFVRMRWENMAQASEDSAIRFSMGETQ